MILGTYRPTEVFTREHPLNGIKRELQLHGLCEELALDFLSESAVAKYLEQRFKVEVTSHSPFHRLARVIHQRTDGSPLFMVNVVNDLIARGMVTQTRGGWELLRKGEESTFGTPVNLHQWIEQQLGQVGAEARTVLATASVVGSDFSAAAVAAGTDQSVEAVEEQCEALVRREQFLCSQGAIEWPDGTVTARYGFVHALYQEVLYEQLSTSRRIRLHRRIGERLEQGYGEQARELAAELAVHFERGRTPHKAVWYQQQAGQRALQRSANHEAIAHLTQGLALLKLLPATAERLQQELVLQTMLGSVLIAAKGYAVPETGVAYAQARKLCEQLEETTQLFPVLAGLWGFHVSRPEHKTAYELGEQLLHLAESRQDPAWLVEAHWTLGLSLFCRGELSAARTQLEQSIAVAAAHEQSTPAFLYGHDPVMSSLCFVANTLWRLGYPEQALRKSQAGVARAREVAHPYSQAYALGTAAECHWLRREEPAATAQAEAVMRLSEEHGIPLFSSMGTVLRGRVRVEQGEAKAGIEQMRQGLVAYEATGAGMMQPYFLALLAEGCGKAGHVEEGLTVVAEALAMVDKTEERWCEAELYRLKGELTLQLKVESPQSKVEEAEECFLKAIEVARKQQAKSLELRAVMSLSWLWRMQGKKEEAHRMLAEIYGWFTEGFDTKDLQEAKALLEELSH
jgi:predicted ATPase